ncbi:MULTISPECIES: S26 family signal peptidase [unclassified Variovorax]|uniref:S26 family signal peptidase n=1 Tax=unclassified Variovorax TaxID=663243 RepID=UPI0008B63A28|nr:MULTISPECIES: S26 family signal peptidase [unclassified Variovorax]SEJ49610.1 conjugative transfer signal peptidase TraF [Variovorax sp. OK202]SFC51359.1 conjugative transfer signal peptidase TraF [Variovorax sp. OK212]
MSPRAPRLLLALCAGVGIAALVAPALHVPAARWVYNPSDSVPRGWYRIEPFEPSRDALNVGDIVLARLPAEAAALAAQRGYLPERIPLLKRIGAMAPQRVCMVRRTVYVDDVPVALWRSADGQGRGLPLWSHCRALRAGELFLLSATNPASFDSRYFGPVDAVAVLGRAQPMWAWGAR